MSEEHSYGADGKKLELDRLIGDRLVELHLRASELVRRWGYANTAKGIRRLRQLRDGHFLPDEKSIEALAAALEIPLARLRGACDATRQQLEQSRLETAEQEWLDWCSRFRPHAILRTNQERPSPIFVAAIFGLERILRLDFDPDQPIETWPFQIVGRLPDRVPAFGSVTGFYLNYSPNRAVAFDREGNAIQQLPVAVRPGQAWMEYKGRDVTSGWRAAIDTEKIF